jgi:flagellin-like protein
MKGISAIVATILMLLITISLAGVAYMYITGVFTSTVQGIEVVDSYCSNNIVTMVIKNSGTNNVTSLTCTQTSPAGDTCSLTGVNIAPGTTQTFTDTCAGTGGRSCLYRIVPPSGRSVEASAFCTG